MIYAVFLLLCPILYTDMIEGIEMERNIWMGSICLFAASAIWGGMYVVSKFVLSELPLFITLWLRYLIAFLILLVILYRKERRIIERQDLPLMIWLAFIGYFIANSSGFYGTHLTTAHMGALLTSVAPVVTFILSSFMLKEKISKKKMVALGTALFGVTIVLGFERNAGENHVWGIILLLFDALSWGMFSVFVKRASLKYSALVITTYSTLLALLMTTPFMILDFQGSLLSRLLKPDIWISILYLGIVATAGAFYLWNKGIELMEAGVGSIFYFFTPLVSAFFGWALLGENLHWNFFLGGGLILLGAGYITIAQGRHPSRNIAVEGALSMKHQKKLKSFQPIFLLFSNMNLKMRKKQEKEFKL